MSPSYRHVVAGARSPSPNGTTRCSHERQLVAPRTPSNAPSPNGVTGWYDLPSLRDFVISFVSISIGSRQWLQPVATSWLLRARASCHHFVAGAITPSPNGTTG